MQGFCFHLDDPESNSVSWQSIRDFIADANVSWYADVNPDEEEVTPIKPVVAIYDGAVHGVGGFLGSTQLKGNYNMGDPLTGDIDFRFAPVVDSTEYWGGVGTNELGNSTVALRCHIPERLHEDEIKEAIIEVSLSGYARYGELEYDDVEDEIVVLADIGIGNEIDLESETRFSLAFVLAEDNDEEVWFQDASYNTDFSKPSYEIKAMSGASPPVILKEYTGEGDWFFTGRIDITKPLKEICRKRHLMGAANTRVYLVPVMDGFEIGASFNLSDMAAAFIDTNGDWDSVDGMQSYYAKFYDIRMNRIAPQGLYVKLDKDHILDHASFPLMGADHAEDGLNLLAEVEFNPPAIYVQGAGSLTGMTPESAAAILNGGSAKIKTSGGSVLASFFFSAGDFMWDETSAFSLNVFDAVASGSGVPATLVLYESGSAEIASMAFGSDAKVSHPTITLNDDVQITQLVLSVRSIGIVGAQEMEAGISLANALTYLNAGGTAVVYDSGDVALATWTFGAGSFVQDDYSGSEPFLFLASPTSAIVAEDGEATYMKIISYGGTPLVATITVASELLVLSASDFKAGETATINRLILLEAAT
jgi:hypothetical protein